MNCTRCGMLLEEAICKECGANHKSLLYKLADDAQVRREYEEAMEYYELIKKSIDDEEELRDINRAIAKLGFSLTDLTGKKLGKEKIKKEVLIGLKLFFIIAIIISVALIVYSAYKLS